MYVDQLLSLQGQFGALTEDIRDLKEATEKKTEKLEEAFDVLDSRFETTKVGIGGAVEKVEEHTGVLRRRVDNTVAKIAGK